MKKTLKISKCSHNPTLDSLQKWYRSSFEQLGWMILALQFNYKDKVQVYKQNTLMLRDCLAKKHKKMADPDKKEDLKIMLNNVEILIKHINKDFK
jgi:hypothetical protein